MSVLLVVMPELHSVSGHFSYFHDFLWVDQLFCFFSLSEQKRSYTSGDVMFSWPPDETSVRFWLILEFVYMRSHRRPAGCTLL